MSASPRAIELGFGSAAVSISTKRIDRDDGFKTVNVSALEIEEKYDYCLVLPVDQSREEKFTKEGQKICEDLTRAGMDLYFYFSADGRDEIIVLIRFREEFVKAFADSIEFPMLLDPSELRARCVAGWTENGVTRLTGREIRDDPTITPYGPYEYIYCRYESEDEYQHLFWRPSDGPNTPFRPSIRLKLTLRKIELPVEQGGAGLDIRSALHKKRILAFFPLTKKGARDELRKEWWKVGRLPNDQPYDKIREYLGEKVALYFEFVGHFSTWLMPVAIIGMGFEMVVAGTANFSHPVIPFFALLLALWSVCMTEYWKRREKLVAMKAGMVDFEKEEHERPEFTGYPEKPQISHIDGAVRKYFPAINYKFRLTTAFVAISFLALCVIGCVAAIYAIRYVLYEKIGTQAQTVASFMNALQVAILDQIYKHAAYFLTDLENHRTDTVYQDSLILKMYAFQFINNYASFYFLAFIAGYLEVPKGAPPTSRGECGYHDCMIPISINLAIIFGTRIIVNNSIKIIIPALKGMMKRRAYLKKSGSVPLTDPEKDFIKAHYDPVKDQIKDYLGNIILFGHMSFFTSALPCAPFFAFLNGYFDIRFSGFNLLMQHQRPLLAGAEDIGSWQPILEFVSTTGVITNAGLVVFTMTVLPENIITHQGRLWIFIGFQWTIFIAQYILAILIPDVPREVDIQLQRQDFLVNKVIFHENIEDDPEVLNANTLHTSAAMKFHIHDRLGNM